jgi:hypothetical protein
MPTLRYRWRRDQTYYYAIQAHMSAKDPKMANLIKKYREHYGRECEWGIPLYYSAAQLLF